LLLALLVALACAPARANAAEVVLLHSTDRDDARTRALARGLADALTGRAAVVPVLLGRRERGDDFFDSRFETLRREFGAASPAAVVADGEAAFAFVRKYREDIFVGSPVIYCSMPAPDPQYLRQCGDCTGLPETADPAATLKLLFTLRPQTGLVVGIMDDSPGTDALRRASETAMETDMETDMKALGEQRPGQARMLFPGHEPGDDAGLDMAQLRAVAASVPRAGAVLFLGFPDLDGERAGNEDEAVRQLVDRSVGPVFTVSDRWMGSGVAGGAMVPGHALGAAIGVLVLRIMDGEPAGEMLPEPVMPRPVVDMAVLARFGVARELVPADALVLNEPSRPQEPAGAAPTGFAALALAGAFGAAYLLLRRRAGRRDR
jgi:hypothetical protein